MSETVQQNKPEQAPLLEVRELVKIYPVEKDLLGRPTRTLKAVDHVSFSLARQETLGIVGESGCGKSTLGRTIVQLEKPTSGKIFFESKDLSVYNREQLRQLRRRVQIIFQDPYASLNPRMTIRELIEDPLNAYGIGTKEERRARVLEMMALVGLDEEYLNRYPHEFSGGQRQRIVIARALILKPDFVICDEPVSALDVSVRSQVLNLLKNLQKELGLTMIFISHDLSVIKYMCGRIAVMYLGHIVEMADKNVLYDAPTHPYTKALLSAIPVPEVTPGKKRQILSGDVPSPVDPPSGCVFHTRCPCASERCSTAVPQLQPLSGDAAHLCACHFAGSPPSCQEK